MLFKHQNPIELIFESCELDANDFELYPGDLVTPGSVIGTDIRTGDQITLNFTGIVVYTYYKPMSHSYLVKIVQIADSRYLEHAGIFQNCQAV